MYRWNSRGYHNSTSSKSNLSENSSTAIIIISARTWAWNALNTFFALFSIFHFPRDLRNSSCLASCQFPPAISTSSSSSSRSTGFSSSCCSSGGNCCGSCGSNLISQTTTSSCGERADSFGREKTEQFCSGEKCTCIHKNNKDTNNSNSTSHNNCDDSSSSSGTWLTCVRRRNPNYICCNIPGATNKSKKTKMAQFLSRTMTLLGVAFLVHFIIMSTFAEREGRIHSFSGQHSPFTPESPGSRHRTIIRRQQRSFRSEKHSGTHHEENTLSPPPLPRFQNKSDAIFFTENSTVITAQIGSKTFLPCAVRNPGSAVASWIRRRDYTILTVGMGTYSNDERFIVAHNRAAQSWELHIKTVKESDAGIYECQITTHPPSSIFIRLSVVEAKAEILGEPDKHVRSGSTFELVCVLRDSTEPPVYVFWYHNDRMINYDNVRGVVVNSDAEKSILTIEDAQKTDSGNYTCTPSNAKPTSISVHILNGEKPAAMQHGSRSRSGKHTAPSYMRLLFVTALAVFIGTTWLVAMNLEQHSGSFHSSSCSCEDEDQRKGSPSSLSFEETEAGPTGESSKEISCLLEDDMTSIGDGDDEGMESSHKYCSLLHPEQTTETGESVRELRMDSSDSKNCYKLVKKRVHVAAAGGGAEWVVDDDFERISAGGMSISATSVPYFFPISVFFLSCNNSSAKLLSSFLLLDVVIASSLFYQIKVYRQNTYLSQILLFLAAKSKNSRLEEVEVEPTGAPGFSSITKVTRPPFVSR